MPLPPAAAAVLTRASEGAIVATAVGTVGMEGRRTRHLRQRSAAREAAARRAVAAAVGATVGATAGAIVKIEATAVGAIAGRRLNGAHAVRVSLRAAAAAAAAAAIAVAAAAVVAAIVGAAALTAGVGGAVAAAVGAECVHTIV